MTNLTIYVNCDTQDQPLNVSGVDWAEMDVDNDEIIISGGSDTVKNGEPIPSSTQLNVAGLLLATPRVDQTYDKYFLADMSSNLLKQIRNMGAGNYRYVMACDFDDETVSEPILEIWDDSNLNSINSVPLGEGTPSASWFRGITTTDGLPGANWVGSRLAGSSDGHFLWLNNQNGELTSAKTLYFQLKVVIPAIQDDAGASVPVMAVKYATI